MVFYVTTSEMEVLLQGAKKLRDVLLLRLMYLGPRVSDIVGDGKKARGLRYENIDWKESIAQLTTKGGSVNTIVIDPDTLNMLRLYCEEKGIKRGKIFNLSRQRVHQIIKDIVHEKGLREQISAHKLRHGFAVGALDGVHLFIRKPLNLRQVQMQLGHTSLEHTAKYLKYTTSDRKAAFGFA